MFPGEKTISAQDMDACVESLNRSLADLAADSAPLTLIIALVVHANARLRVATDAGLISGPTAERLGDDMLRHLASLEARPSPDSITRH
jgi:hypothetical protein